MNVYQSATAKATEAGQPGRQWLLESRRMRAAIICFAPGEDVADHAHLESDEVFHFLSGTCTMRADGETAVVGPGDVAVVPAGEYHGLTAHDEPLVLLAVVAPNLDDAAWPQASRP